MSLHDIFKGLLFQHGHVNPFDAQAIAALKPATGAPQGKVEDAAASTTPPAWAECPSR